MVAFALGLYGQITSLTEKIHVNKRLAISLLCSLFPSLLSCVSVESFVKPGTNFSDYKSIAVMQFESAAPGVGQEVSDLIGMEFLKKGFKVVERSQLRAIVDENVLIQTGLTEESSKMLKIAGISCLVVGTVSSFSSSSTSAPIMVDGKYAGSLPVNNCSVSLSIKMLDVSDGSLIWSASGSHSEQSMGLTPQKVLKMIMDKMKDNMPSLI